MLGSHFRAICLILACVGHFPLAGCGSAGKGKLDVHGTVMVEGKPAAYGEIMFSPLEKENPGRTMTTEVREGNYDLRPNGGVTAGKSQVTLKYYDLNFTPKDWNNLTPQEEAKLNATLAKYYAKEMVVDKGEFNIEFTAADFREAEARPE